MQGFQTIEPGHVLIECDDVDAALREAVESFAAARRANDLEAEPRQAALNQPGECLVIVDIQERWHLRDHVAAVGT